ncbi:GIDE domain-containing protein [Chitinimonas naiadis]
MRHLLRQYWWRLLTSFGWLPLLYIALHLDTLLFKSVLALACLLGLWAWTSHWRRYRAIADTPTSRLASAAQGYVELFGRGRNTGQAAISPLTGLPCLWYRFERLGKTRRSQLVQLSQSAKLGQTPRWTFNQGTWLRHSGQSDAPFLLEDGSGTVRIDPRRAEVFTSRYSEHVQDGYRYGEWLLLEHDQLYVLGELVSHRGADHIQNQRADIAAKLAEWKADPTALLARYDRNGDGELSLEEWELARADAAHEVAAEYRAQSVAPVSHALRRPHDGRPFLIANQAPELLANRHRYWAWLQLLIALAAGGCLLWSSLSPPDWLHPAIEFHAEAPDDE